MSIMRKLKRIRKLSIKCPFYCLYIIKFAKESKKCIKITCIGVNSKQVANLFCQCKYMYRFNNFFISKSLPFVD